MDSADLARRLSRLALERGTRQDVLLEVNIAGEQAKHGWETSDLIGEARALESLEGIRVAGMMCMGPQAREAEQMRPYFKKARLLWRELIGVFPEAEILSMGMSQDFEVAIEEGATMVRVGRAIFKP